MKSILKMLIDFIVHSTIQFLSVVLLFFVQFISVRTIEL